MNCEAYQDFVAAHVDGVLSPAERQEVESHLTSCALCQRLFQEESRFRAAFTARQFVVAVPAEVEQRLHAALAAESPPIPSWRDRLSALLWQLRLAFGLAAAASVIALLLPRLFSSPSDSAPAWFSQVLDSYLAATEGRLSFTYHNEDPQELEAVLNQSGQLDFVTHVLDLRLAGYQIEGGQVVWVKDHPVAVVLYQGKDGPIVCLRQRGMAPPMPAGSEGQTGQYLYTRAGYTVSCTQFSGHFCMLITRLSREALMRRLVVAPAT